MPSDGTVFTKNGKLWAKTDVNRDGLFGNSTLSVRLYNTGELELKSVADPEERGHQHVFQLTLDDLFDMIRLLTPDGDPRE